LRYQGGWTSPRASTPPPQRAAIEEITPYYFPIIYGVAIPLVFAARGVRALVERRRGSITVSYPSRKVRVPKGLSILETSLRFKLPHVSVCGGRARCSTCPCASSASVPRSRDPRAPKLSCCRASAPTSCATAAASISATSVTSSHVR
jgi:ferredoxin